MSAESQQLVSDALVEFLALERAMVAAIISSSLEQLCRFKGWFDSEVAQQLSPAYLCIPSSLIIMPVQSELLLSAASFEATSRSVIVVDAEDDA